MAIVTFVKYKPGRNSTPSAMRAVINYCIQPYKTQLDEQVYSIEGKDCNGEFAYREFMATKELYHKADGVMFYHYVQSFSPNENITPEEANKIGIELAKEFGGFEVLVATHIDREHIHNHLIINSVSFENGYKLRQNPNSLKKLRDRSDDICQEFGKSVLPRYEKHEIKGLGSREYRVAEKGESFKFKLMATIDNAMNKSGDRTSFVSQMKKFGYQMTWSDTRKYITFVCPDGQKCRDIKLHDKKYLKENLENELNIRKAIINREVKTEQPNSNNRYGERTISPSSIRSEQYTGGNINDLAQEHQRVSTDTIRTDIKACNLEGNQQQISRDTEHRIEIHEQNSGQCSFGESGLSGRDEKTIIPDAGEFKTGWEKSREIYFGFLKESRRKDNSTRISDIRTTPQNCSINLYNTNSIGSALSNLFADSAELIDENSEDPEERRRRIEAEENGANLGAVVGVAVGLAMALNEQDEDTDEFEEIEDEENNKGYFGPVMGGM